MEIQIFKAHKILISEDSFTSEKLSSWRYKAYRKKVDFKIKKSRLQTEIYA